jgi:flagellar basal-body rod protein FlgF
MRLSIISRITVKSLEKVGRNIWLQICTRLHQISMDPIAVTAASGLRARIQSLDMLANNLANSTTAGYKLDREFYSVFGEEDNAVMGGGTKLPSIDKHWTDFTQGNLEPTGNPLDLALSGKGFFTANGPSGPLYTRNGSFRVSPQGVLTTADGYALRSQVVGALIKVKPGASIEISTDGTVSQEGQPIARLAITDFADPAALTKSGNSYFRAAANAVPVAPKGTTVEQGRLESSNVVAAESAVRLVGVMRHFEMLQKAITISTQMGKKAVEEVARVGS